VLDPVEVRVPAPPAQGAAAAPGAAVTTIDAARFAGASKGAAELLATAPGVAISDHGGPGQLATVSIRGSSAEQVKVLLDGLPLNGAAGGGVDLSSIPARWISRIEVVRGTEGVHHGSGALGGVVNVVTAPAQGATWAASATGGSFGTWEAEGRGGLGAEDWGLLGSATGSGTGGDFRFVNPYADGAPTQTREHNASALGGGLLKGFALVGGGRLDAAAQASGGRRDLPGWPGNLTPRDWQEDARGLVTARYRRPTAGGPLLSAGASVRLDRLVVRLTEVGGGDPIHQQGLAASATAGAEWRWGVGTLSVALDAGGERLDADGIGLRSRPVLAAVLAGELQILSGRARIGPGVRVERTGDYTGLSAKLGCSVGLAGPLSLRATAGRSYRVPSFSELYLQQGVVAPNPDLRPEIGLGGDAALVADGWLGTASAGLFATLYEDLIVYEAASFRRFMPRNDARSLARGGEVEVATTPLRRAGGLAAGLAYTFMDTEALRGREDVLGKDLPHKPRHRLYARLGAGGEAAEAHAEAQWISRQWIDGANRRQIHAAFTMGAGGSVRLLARPALHLHGEVKNLLDDLSLTDSFGNPLPGRTVLFTVRAGSPGTGDHR
jgi:iron complex outermembrane receptor protein